MSDVILFAHPAFGVLGILAAVWAFAETPHTGARQAGHMGNPGLS